MAYKISKSGLTTITFDDATVSEDHDLMQEVDVFPTPAGDTDEAIALGENGAQRNIVLDVLITEASIATLRTTLNNLKEYLTVSDVTYESDLWAPSGSELTVAVESISVRYKTESTGTLAVLVTIRMVEGSSS
jgi:hypothetical protein